jgi:hypothetical protein
MTGQEPQEPKKRAPGGGRKPDSQDGKPLKYVSLRVHPDRVEELKEFAKKLKQPPEIRS